ncbi:MAG: hypothetical protein LBU29_00965, partial [Endomicrobium sp.]|nr:hypothetical protein [Endomicrobium sp.]
MHIILDNSLYNSGQKPRQVVKEKGTGLYFLHFQLSWVLSFVNKEASLSAVAPFKRILWICEKRFIRNCIEKGVSD